MCVGSRLPDALEEVAKTHLALLQELGLRPPCSATVRQDPDNETEAQEGSYKWSSLGAVRARPLWREETSARASGAVHQTRNTCHVSTMQWPRWRHKQRHINPDFPPGAEASPRTSLPALARMGYSRRTQKTLFENSSPSSTNNRIC